MYTPFEQTSAKRVVGEDGTISLTGCNAVGFALRPVKGAGGYPVRVVVDGDDARPVVVDSPDLYCDLRNAFHTLKMEAGNRGDEWEVILRPAETDEHRTRLLRNGRGSLVVAHQAPITLFDLDSSRNRAKEFAEMWGTGKHTGSFHVPSDNPTRFVYRNEQFDEGEVGAAWDVSSFRRVLLTLEISSASSYFPADSVKLFTDHYSPGGFARLAIVGAGTVNEFKTSLATVGGFIDLTPGGPIAAEGAYRVVYPLLLPAIRFRVEMVGTGPIRPMLESGELRMRLAAFGY